MREHLYFFFFSSRRRHTRSYGDWSSDVCSSDLRESVLGRKSHLWRRPWFNSDRNTRPNANHWLLQEIVQRIYSRHHRRQRRRNLRIAGICPVLFSVHHIFVNRGMQRFLYLGCGARKLDYGSPFGHLADLKAVHLQPRCDGLKVLIRRTELPPELLRRKPFVVVGRSFLLLVIQQLS